MIAQRDLKAAKIIIHYEEESVSVALYLSQQCAEKALKAYLVFQKIPIQKTHDLLKLTYACTEFEPSFQQLVEDAIELNPLSTSSRYPDDFYIMPDITTAKILFKKAEHILQFVQNKILD